MLACMQGIPVMSVCLKVPALDHMALGKADVACLTCGLQEGDGADVAGLKRELAGLLLAMQERLHCLERVQEQQNGAIQARALHAALAWKVSLYTLRLPGDSCNGSSCKPNSRLSCCLHQGMMNGGPTGG